MSIGIWQVILILAIVLIIFGAGKLPRVMGDLAKGIKSFKSGMKEDEDETPKVATKVGEGESMPRATAAEKKEPAQG